MKELFSFQLVEMRSQFMFSCMAGYAGAVLFWSGRHLSSKQHKWMLRLPVWLTFTSTMCLFMQNYPRHCQPYHDLMAQPAPHGSYLRRTVREHFPYQWRMNSAQLYRAGINVPEMNEYDKSTEMPKSSTIFNSNFY